jgi:hypothetical protein
MLLALIALFAIESRIIGTRGRAKSLPFDDSIGPHKAAGADWSAKKDRSG